MGFSYFHPQPIEKGKSFQFNLSHLGRLDIKPIEMIWVEPCTFMMGSPEGQKFRNDSREGYFEVTLTDGYWLAKYPLTVAQRKRLSDFPFSTQSLNGDNYPQPMSWYDSVIFSWDLYRSHLVGAESYIPEGYRFTLPTEAQWECACRAGTESIFYNGDDPEKIDDIAWYKANSNEQLHPVGEKQPNAWGFHDMLGNLDEWCWDFFDEVNPTGPQVNWVNAHSYSMLPYHVIKGGDNLASLDSIRCAERGYMTPDVNAGVIGFRLCLTNIPHDLPDYMK